MDLDVPSTSTSTAVSNTDQNAPKIQSGNNVLVRQPNGDVRSIKIDRDSCVFCSTVQSICSRMEIISNALSRTVVVGRMGSFHANELIGQPFGFSYEMVDKKLKILPVRTLEEIGMEFLQSTSVPSLNGIYAQRIQMPQMNS